MKKLIRMFLLGLLSKAGYFVAKVGPHDYIIHAESSGVTGYSWNKIEPETGFTYEYSGSYHGGTLTSLQAIRFVKWANNSKIETEYL